MCMCVCHDDNKDAKHRLGLGKKQQVEKFVLQKAIENN